MITDESSFSEVNLRCGNCCRNYVICIGYEDFNRKTEAGRHITKYLKPRLEGAKPLASIAKRKRRKTCTAGAAAYRRTSAEYKSARRAVREDKGTT